MYFLPWRRNSETYSSFPVLRRKLGFWSCVFWRWRRSFCLGLWWRWFFNLLLDRGGLCFGDLLLCTFLLFRRWWMSSSLFWWSLCYTFTWFWDDSNLVTWFHSITFLGHILEPNAFARQEKERDQHNNKIQSHFKEEKVVLNEHSTISYCHITEILPFEGCQLQD